MALLGTLLTEFLAKTPEKSGPGAAAGSAVWVARNLADCRKLGMKKGGGTMRGKEWLWRGETRAPLVWCDEAEKAAPLLWENGARNGEHTVLGGALCLIELATVPTGIVAVFSVRTCLGGQMTGTEGIGLASLTTGDTKLLSWSENTLIFSRSEGTTLFTGSVDITLFPAGTTETALFWGVVAPLAFGSELVITLVCGSGEDAAGLESSVALDSVLGAFSNFSLFEVLSELASLLSAMAVSVLWRRPPAVEGRPALLLVGVLAAALPFEMSPFLTFRFFPFLVLAPRFLRKKSEVQDY